MRGLVLITTMLLAMTASSFAAVPSSQQVISSLQKNYAGIRDYKVDAVLTVKSDSINVSGMPMTIFYKQPGKVHIEAQEGFAMLPRNMRIGNPAADISKNFDITVLNTEKFAGRNAAVVRLKPKNQPQGNNDSLKAWIDTERGLLLSMAGGGTDSRPQVKSNWTYTKVDGKYWLPSQIKAEMKVPQAGAYNPDPSDPDRQKGRFHRPKLGEGTMTVKFRNYRVNKGIPDSVFKEPGVKGKN